MYQKIKTLGDFNRQAKILRSDDYDDLELEVAPCAILGGFYSSRADDLLSLAGLHPEFHIVTCIDPDLFVNAFVKEGAQAYYLAENDPNPKLIYDLRDQFDAFFSYSLNSGRSKRSA